ncbi:MAG: hypothetical protein ACREJ2_01920 [Planctomycetota bacterium]
MARHRFFPGWLAALGLLVAFGGSLRAEQTTPNDSTNPKGGNPAPTITGTDPAPAPTSSPNAPNAPNPAPDPATSQTPQRMDIADAVEGLVDEDEPTRRRAFHRLDAADAADIPALEKFAKSSDPEIRRQVDLILKRLKRGALAFTLQYPDGKPVVGLKLSVLVYQADQVQVYSNGGRVNVMYKAPRNGPAKEDFEADVTSDANGLITVGRFNDGDYACLVEAGDPLPTQNKDVTVHLREDTGPAKVELKRGVNLTVTVLDGDGKPVPDATVINVDQGAYLRNLQQQEHNSQMLMALSRQFTSATSDEKGVAELDRIGLEEIHPVAFKEGYDAAIGDKQDVADGGKGAVTLKLIKTQPVKMEMNFIDQTTGKPLRDVRVVMVQYSKMMAAFGARWYVDSKEDQIPTYVKNGAIDLKSTSKEGTIKGEFLPETYMVLGFSGTAVYCGNVPIPGHGGSVAVRLAPIRR